jgi:hypothetical protein
MREPRQIIPELQCPGCGDRSTTGERFCASCGMPLVLAGPDPPAARDHERRAWARKIKPQLAEGALVRVTWARNQAEGEFIQGLLLEEGVPSILRRSAGFDVPDFLAAGPRDVLVPHAGLATAREVLLQSEIIREDTGGSRRVVEPVWLAAGLLAALGGGALLIWLMILILGG